MTLETNKIHQGDCVENLRRLQPESVDLVFADPPFNIGYKYDVYDDRQQAEDYLKWCRQWIDGVYQALKPTGTFWLAIGDEFAAELKIAAQESGFHCRSWIIWYYTFGVNCVNGFTRSHTHIFYFVKDKKKFTFNRMNPQIRVPSARQLVYGDKRANPSGRLPDNTWILRPQDAPDSFVPAHDTWYYARVAGTFKEREGFHGCQMPEQLLARIIRCSSNPQELVVDPFGGSGTTLCVAKKLARRFIGFELSEEYVNYIDQRLARTSIGAPLDGPEDPVVSAPTTKQGRKLDRPFAPQVQQAVIQAFVEVSHGLPLEHLLCDPAVADQFYKLCQQQKLGGNATVWLRYLLDLQAEQSLPVPTAVIPSIDHESVQDVVPAVEVAWRLLEIDFQQSLPGILSSPELAREFDRLVGEYANQEIVSVYPCRRIAWAMHDSAADVLSDFDDSDSAVAVDDLKHQLQRAPVAAEQMTGLNQQWMATAGVFVLYAQQVAVYVADSRQMYDQVQSLLANENWQKLNIDSVGFIAEPSPQRRAIIQAELIRRENSLLNHHRARGRLTQPAG